MKKRWGQIAEPKEDSWFDKVAKSVYKPEIYKKAALELIAEGHATADEFPDFDKETGYKPPQPDFIDNITYDGSKPNEYLSKFKIGLKGSDKL